MKGRVGLNAVGMLIFIVMGSSCAPLAPTPKIEESSVNRIILQVPYPAGGSTDIGARILAPFAERELGKPIVVVNKVEVGKGPLLGWAELANQKPDGNYLGMINLPVFFSIILDPKFKSTIKAEDIVPIISQTLDPVTISVRPDSPWKTLQEVIDDAKKRPNQISAAFVGSFQDGEIGYFHLAESASIEMKRVIFTAAAPAVTSLYGKYVDALFCTASVIYSQWKAGKIRILAILEKERSKFYPDVPTAAELGYPTVTSASARGIAAPKGVPEPVMKNLQEGFKKAMMTKEHIEKIEKSGTPVKIMVGEEFVKYYWDNYQLVKKWMDQVRKK